MCQVAGEVADGVRPHPVCTPDFSIPVRTGHDAELLRGMLARLRTA
jgi:hypothetical protein